jgi:UDP-N-acetylmuramoylalanine--D-glutamate ligase
MKIVVGLGKTGLSCVRHLVAAGDQVLVADSRECPPGLDELMQQFPSVRCVTGEFDADLFATATQLVVSPGIAVSTPAIAHAAASGVEIVGDVELFCRLTRKPVIAITGSNAKSTVTTLVGEMAKAAGFRASVAGNIGLPVLDVLANEAGLDLHVLELSSFQLETTSSLRAQAATILNISPDHLDRYPGMDEYIAAKHRIYGNATSLVFNADDAQTFPAADLSGRRIAFQSSTPAAGEFGLIHQDGQVWLALGDQRLLASSELKIKGRHNHVNALAALALGQAAGFPLQPMLKALTTFAGLPHRCQWVRDRKGVQWYNDSKGTNVGATVAAIEGLGSSIPGRVVLIAGGDGKGADFLELIEPSERFLSSAVLIGRDADRLERVLSPTCQVLRAETLVDAVRKAAVLASPGDAVLLSPACASFDMFKGYDDRGNQFVQAVSEL